MQNNNISSTATTPLLIIRRHWVVWLFLFIVCTFILILTIIFFIFFKNIISIIWELLSWTLITVFWVFSLFTLMILWSNIELDTLIITEKTITFLNQKAFFNRETSEFKLSKIQEVRSKIAGFFPTILWYGTLSITTASNENPLVFRFVPRPDFQVEKINEILKKYR